MSENAKRLIETARKAAGFAHAPYSRFGVGAAILMDDGSIVTGTNFENASYGLSLCAETVALAKANSEGKLRKVLEIGAIGGMQGEAGALTGADIVRPCGRCRQILNEAAEQSQVDIDVHCSSGDGTAVASYKLSELLPHSFGPKDLGFVQ